MWSRLNFNNHILPIKYSDFVLILLKVCIGNVVLTFCWCVNFKFLNSKFYRRHYELISKFNVGLKSLLHQGLSEPEFYGDLVFKLKKIRGMTDFSYQFRNITMRYKLIGYNLNVMRQSACLGINPITIDGYAALFNCTPVDRASDSMMAPT